MELVSENKPLLITDVEGRRPGSRIGLDTLVVQADNYECYILQHQHDINENVSIPPQE